MIIVDESHLKMKAISALRARSLAVSYLLIVFVKMSVKAVATLGKVSANDVKSGPDTEKEHAYCLLSAQRRVREEYLTS